MLKLNALMPAARLAVKKVQLKAVQHAPEILTIGGAAVTIGGGVLACIATTKLPQIKEPAMEQLEQVRDWRANPDKYESYSEEQATAMTIKVYGSFVLGLAKLYAPSVILAGLGIGAMIGGNYILRKRNLALAAAYTAIDTSYKQYRARVVEKYGKDADHELRFGKQEKQITETVVDSEGNETTETKTVTVPEPVKDPYVFWIGKGNPNWVKNPEYNELFLRQIQQWACDKLRADGWLCLNDVLYSLRLPRVDYGQRVGWVCGKNNTDGDNFVSFGIDYESAEYEAFMNGETDGLYLDFNVQGDILTLINAYEPVTV